MVRLTQSISSTNKALVFEPAWSGRDLAWRVFRWMIFLALTLSVSRLEAIDPTVALSESIHTPWTTQKGLPHQSLQAIAQDDLGYLWIGTDGGLARFDGHVFTVFDLVNLPALKDAGITRLKKGARGGLWIGTERGGLTFLDRTRSRHWGRKEGLTDLHVVDLGFDSEGQLIVATADQKVHVLVDGRIMTFDPLGAEKSGAGRSISSFWVDGDDGLWVGTHGHGLFHVNLKLTGAPARPVETPHPRIQCMAGNAAQGLWVLGNDFSVSRIRSGKLEETFKPARVLDERPHSAFLSRSGILWVGTSRGRILAFNEGKPSRETELREFFPDTVTCVFEDREGTLWAGVHQNGLHRLHESAIRMLETKTRAISSNTRVVMELADGSLMSGHQYGGLGRFEKHEFVEANPTGSSFEGAVLALEEASRGGVWFAVQGLGLGRVQAGTLRMYGAEFHPGLSDIRAILEQPDGSVWIGTRKAGVLRLEGGKFTDLSVAEELTQPEVRFLYRDRSHVVWAGTHGGGLQRWTGNRFEQVGRSKAETTLNVRWISEDHEGDLWFGTLGQGFGMVSGGKIFRMAPGAGSPEETINAVLHDMGGSAWLAGDLDVHRIDAKELKAACREGREKPRWINVAQETGEQLSSSNGGSRRPALITSGGDVALATKSGVLMIKPLRLAREMQTSPVLIEEVTSDGKAVSPIPGLRMAAGRGAASFRFTSMTLRNSRPLEFEHWLEGVDPGWQRSPMSRMAHYTYLPPGNYHFQVRARSIGGSWPEPTRFPFSIEAHFYQTKWFYLALGAVAIGLAAFVHLRRLGQQRAVLELRQMRGQETDRARIAQDLHDDMGAMLAKIQLQATQISTDPTGETLADVAETSRHLLRALNETVWATTPGNDTLDSFVAYLCAFAQALFASSGIKSRFLVPHALPSLAMRAEVRHECYMASKEALTNALKHSKASEVILEVMMEKERLRIEIRDNGVGFDASTYDDFHHGLKNMKSRLASLGAGCECHSRPGLGTTVRLIVPLSLLTV